MTDGSLFQPSGPERQSIVAEKEWQQTAETENIETTSSASHRKQGKQTRNGVRQ